MNPMPQSNEVLQWNPDDKIKISSLEEFKKQLKINNLPDNLKEYFTQPLETTKGELLELRKKYLSKQPNDETIISFLEKSKKDIIEKTQAWLKQVKKVASNINQSAKIEAKKIAEWKIDWQKADDLLKNTIWKTNDTIKKWVDTVSSSETVKKWTEKIKKATKKAWEIVKKWINTVKKSKWFIWFINSLENLKEKWWIWGLFASLLLFIFWLFWFWKNKLEKTWEKAKELLSWTEATKVRKEVVTKIQNDLLKIKWLDPITRNKLNKVLNNPKLIPDKNLKELKEILEKHHKLTLSDLKLIFSKKEFQTLQKEIFSPEDIKRMKAETEKTIVDKIYKTYNLDLRTDKRAQLKKLVSEHMDSNINFIALKNKFGTSWVGLWDILPIAFSQSWNIASFIVEVIAKWIIPPWKLLIYAWKKWTETISLWLSSLWIKSSISIENFKKEIDNMSETERWLLLWVLYRHTWFLSTIIWNLTQFSLRILINWITKTPVNSFEAWLAATWGNIEKQIEIFKQLESAFWKHTGNDLIKDMLNNIKKLKTNNKIIQLLNESNNNAANFKEMLSKLDPKEYSISSEILDSIKNETDLTKIRKTLSKNIHPINSGISETLSNELTNLWFSEKKYEYQVTKDFDNILRYQREAIKTWTLPNFGKFFTKLWEISWYSNLSRHMEQLVINVKNPTEAITKSQALKNLFTEFPQLSKSFFGSLPEIAFVWLAISGKKEDETWLKTITENISYMIPFIGPAKLLFSARASYNKEWIKWYNLTEASTWLVLWTIDIWFAWKTFIWGWSGIEKTIKIWNYILKPITSTYKLGRDMIKTSFNIAKVIKAEWKLDLWKIATESWSKFVKLVKEKPWKATLIIAAILTAAYIWHEMFKDDIWDEFKELEKEWIIDNQWNIINKEKLKQLASTMNEDDKKALIEIIFMTARIPTSKFEFELKWKKLNIISHNEMIKSDWILTDNNSKILDLLNLIWISPQNVNFEYKKPA